MNSASVDETAATAVVHEQSLLDRDVSAEQGPVFGRPVRNRSCPETAPCRTDFPHHWHAPQDGMIMIFTAI